MTTQTKFNTTDYKMIYDLYHLVVLLMTKPSLAKMNTFCQLIVTLFRV
jgi:hypothetical protein